VAQTRQSAFLCLQQAPLQEPLHVTTPIGNQEHIGFVFHDAVNDAVGLEEYFVETASPHE
jgi:hypothetical protein